jgi:predicted DNA-binding transcriptional regulator AlpA
MQTHAELPRSDPRLRQAAAHGGPWCAGRRHDCADRTAPGEAAGKRLAADWEWASSSELAQWLGIGVPALAYLRQKKEAPRGHRVGKEIRYRRGDVERWLATRADQ